MKKVIFENYEIHSDGSLYSLKSGIKKTPRYNKTYDRLYVNVYYNGKKHTCAFNKLMEVASITGYNKKTDRIGFIYININFVNYPINNVSSNLFWSLIIK